jgi:siroheme decarboxylase
MCPPAKNAAPPRPADRTLTRLEQEVLTRIQRDFPLSPEPYADLAGDLGCTLEEAWRSVTGLRQHGIIRRIGGSFAAAALGYHSTLVAAQVDPERLEEAAAVASAFPEVTHNYERSGAFNLWFTVIAADQARLEAILTAVRQAPGVRALHELPARRQVKIRVDFPFGEGDRTLVQEPAPAADGSAPPLALDALDRRVIFLSCGDLGLDQWPFRAWAATLGITEVDLLARLRAYGRAGAMRRFGAILRHQTAGFTANGMSVWDVPAADTAGLCERLAACPEVSHCYERPRFPGWPYNVFAMIHGHSREDCLSVARQVAADVGAATYDILFSLREFKKTSMVYFAETATGGHT